MSGFELDFSEHCKLIQMTCTVSYDCDSSRNKKPTMRFDPWAKSSRPLMICHSQLSSSAYIESDS